MMNDRTVTEIIGWKAGEVCACKTYRLYRPIPNSYQLGYASALTAMAIHAPHDDPIYVTHDMDTAREAVAKEILTAGAGHPLDSEDITRAETALDETSAAPAADRRVALRTVEPWLHAGTLLVAARLAGLATAARLATATDDDSRTAELCMQVLDTIRLRQTTKGSIEAGMALHRHAAALGVRTVPGTMELVRVGIKLPGAECTAALTALVRREITAGDVHKPSLGRARHALVGV